MTASRVHAPDPFCGDCDCCGNDLGTCCKLGLDICCVCWAGQCPRCSLNAAAADDYRGQQTITVTAEQDGGPVL